MKEFSKVSLPFVYVLADSVKKLDKDRYSGSLLRVPGADPSIDGGICYFKYLPKEIHRAMDQDHPVSCYPVRYEDITQIALD